MNEQSRNNEVYSRAPDQEALPTAYRQAVLDAQDEFARKVRVYGPAWLLLRPSSMVDQALIKAFRLRKLWGTGAENRVGESIQGDLRALLNYAAMGIYVVRSNRQGAWPDLNVNVEDLVQAIDAIRTDCALLLLRKNHDYDEAWRQFGSETFIDLILTKLFRLRSMEPATADVESMSAEWIDIHNYAALAHHLLVP